MRRLLIVRHGETLQNAQGLMVSTDDPALSGAGESQVTALAEALAHIPMTRVITSPMRRCRQTTDALVAAQVLPVPVEVDDRLRELRFGDIEGLGPREIAARGLGEVFLAWRQGRPPLYPAGAETFEDAAVRLRAAYDDATLRQEQCTVLVGHSHALRIVLAVSVLGVDPEVHRRMRLDHGAMTEVQWENDVPRLTALNARSLPAR